MHSTIPSKISRSKEISNRDIVSQVVYTQVLDMGLAPVSVSCCQRRQRQLNFKYLTIWCFLIAQYQWLV